MSKREELLDEAKHHVTGQRATDYGSAEDNFGIIADYWSTHLSMRNQAYVEIEACDVAIMMILMKQARLATSPDHKDSWVDIAGYAACGHEVTSKEDMDPDLIGRLAPSKARLEHSKVVIYCHSKDECSGEFCTLHKRSNHVMRSWKQHWRDDSGVMERLCPTHSIGHPDPDSPWEDGDARWVHGCCGCEAIARAYKTEGPEAALKERLSRESDQ